MQTDEQRTDVARKMMAVQDARRQIEPWTSRLAGFDLPDAYEVAEVMHRARLQNGAAPVGRKIGFTNPSMWARYGVNEPIWSYVYDRTLETNAAGHFHCDPRLYCEPKLEPEIVFHFHSAPPADGREVEILACVDWIAHGFELVQSHYPGWSFEAADTVVDGALHGKLFVGAPQPVDQLGPDVAARLRDFQVSLSCDGVLRASGMGADVLGSPLLALEHLIGIVARRDRPLQAGELVTTGTITPAQLVRPGERWTTKIRGIALPGLSMHLAG